jgi:hypothetical protein
VRPVSEAPPATPSDVVDALDEADTDLLDEICFIERIARQRGDIMDFRAGTFSATSHLRRRFDLEDLDSPRVVDGLTLRSIAAHLDTALDAANDAEARYHIRQSAQLLVAMTEGTSCQD